MPWSSSLTFCQTTLSVATSSELVGSSRITMRRVAQEGAGQGQALALAAGEGHAVLPEHGVVALGAGRG